MEAVVLIPCVLGLLLLPLLAGALCVRCRELPAVPNSTLRVWDPRALHSRPLPCHLSSCLTGFSSPGSYDRAASDSLTPSSIVLKRPPTVVPWPSATSYAPVTSYPSLSQPDLLPIPRSPQPHHMPSSRQDSEGANSVASYENEEPVCEDEEEEEEDYHNEGYLEVLPDSTPAPSSAVPPASVPSNPGLRDSAFSMESGEDYVNVLESEESADVSLDGSREYVNVSQELPPMAKTEPAILSSQKVEDEDDEEEEGAPDYENL